MSKSSGEHVYSDFKVKACLCVISDMFGDECVNVRDGRKLSVTVDGVTVVIDPQTRVRDRLLSLAPDWPEACRSQQWI